MKAKLKCRILQPVSAKAQQGHKIRAVVNGVIET